MSLAFSSRSFIPGMLISGWTDAIKQYGHKMRLKFHTEVQRQSSGKGLGEGGGGGGLKSKRRMLNI